MKLSYIKKQIFHKFWMDDSKDKQIYVRAIRHRNKQELRKCQQGLMVTGRKEDTVLDAEC